jgi:thymidylate kinase
MKTKLITITDDDGSGKSTLCQLLEKNLCSIGLKSKEVSIWDMIQNPKWKNTIPFQDKKTIGKYLISLSPKARSLFLIHCLFQAYEDAKEQNYDYMIMNSYWYKYIISEIVFGVDKEWLLKIVSIFPSPDFTFFLEISPELSLKRKNILSDYESMGVHNPKSNFLENQKKSLIVWEEFATKYQWIRLDAQSSPEELLSLILNYLGIKN